MAKKYWQHHGEITDEFSLRFDIRQIKRVLMRDGEKVRVEPPTEEIKSWDTKGAFVVFGRRKRVLSIYFWRQRASYEIPLDNDVLQTVISKWHKAKTRNWWGSGIVLDTVEIDDNHVTINFLIVDFYDKHKQRRKERQKALNRKARNRIRNYKMRGDIFMTDENACAIQPDYYTVDELARYDELS